MLYLEEEYDDNEYEIVFDFSVKDVKSLNVQLIAQIGLKSDEYDHETYVSFLEKKKLEPISFAALAYKISADFYEMYDMFEQTDAMLDEALGRNNPHQKILDDIQREQEDPEEALARIEEDIERKDEASLEELLENMRQRFEGSPASLAHEKCGKVTRLYLEALSEATNGKVTTYGKDLAEEDPIFYNFRRSSQYVGKETCDSNSLSILFESYRYHPMKKMVLPMMQCL